MEKYEYDDTLKVLYKSTRKTPFFVDVPQMNYITYNGKGHPSGEDFQEACNSLFSLSYQERCLNSGSHVPKSVPIGISSKT